ncbi:regulatory protein GemA [Pseudotabrizicola algicola]|nr:regulatory protein GemA [Pseudotabrizicola algicola]
MEANMAISPRQISLIKLAVRQLKIPDDVYRTALAQFGVTSCTEFDAEGFNAFMAWLERVGFRPMEKKGPDYGERPGMASLAQLELIRNLWNELTHHHYQTEDQLNAWLLRTFKVSSLRFVTKPLAQKIITALKAMRQRAA